MRRYLFERIGQALIVLWAAYTATFLILYLLPSNPIALRLSGANVQVQDLTPAQLAQLEAQYGLNKPVAEQYFSMLWNALHLNFGQSTSLSLPVSTVLAQRLPTTVTLAGFAVLFMLVLGFGVAYAAAWAQWRPAKAVLSRLPAIGVSVPSFWVGLLLIQVFSFDLGWFPSTGSNGLSSYVLPAVSMALPAGAVLAQVLTSSFERTLREPYIATARAKGLSRGAIQFRHALRNAALPTLTLLGLLIATAVTGAVIAETVFSISGVGRLAQQAVLSQDVPVVQAIVLVAAVLFVVVNLIVDLLYPLLDPRIAYTPKVV
ncbi:MAG TPA: ABC transporter permease [Actinocrinis sp.]|nr:ABC transporter permease [Actinocrinis sp.]